MKFRNQLKSFGFIQNQNLFGLLVMNKVDNKMLEINALNMIKWFHFVMSVTKGWNIQHMITNWNVWWKTFYHASNEWEKARGKTSIRISSLFVACQSKCVLCFFFVKCQHTFHIPIHLNFAWHFHFMVSERVRVYLQVGILFW